MQSFGLMKKIANKLRPRKTGKADDLTFCKRNFQYFQLPYVKINVFFNGETKLD